MVHSPDPDELTSEITPFLNAETTNPRQLRPLVGALGRSARRAGIRSIANGRWMTSVVLEVLPKLPIRSEETLRSQHGVSGAALADVLVLNASRASATVGAAMGALAGGAEATGAGIVTLPIPVVLDAVLTALIEMKLIAELHEALGRPIPGRGSARAVRLAQAWAAGRGISTETVLSGGTVLLSGTARRELARIIRRKLIRRAGRSLSALAPVLAGSLAAAAINRRGTLKLAASVRADLE